VGERRWLRVSLNSPRMVAPEDGGGGGHGSKYLIEKGNGARGLATFRRFVIRAC